MGRRPHIPPELHPEIIIRSTLGHTTTQIYEWLSHADGARPAISTSRQAVLRVIEEQLADHSEQARLAIVNRARLRALSVYEAYDNLGDQLLQCADSTEKEMSPEALRRLVVRTQILAKASAHYTRQLRGAGTMGPSADRLVEQWSDVTRDMRERRKRAAPETEESVRNSEPNPAETRENESDTQSEIAANISPDPPPVTAPPEVRQAFSDGMALGPCRLTTMSATVDDFELTSESVPLTETEQAFAAGYAVGWQGNLAEREERTPGDDAHLLDRTVAEMQFQKQRIHVEFLAQQRREDIDDPPPTLVVEEVILAPETPVPRKYASNRRLREAYRAGLEDSSPAIDMNDTKSYDMPQDVPLTEHEKAWAAGRDAFLEARAARHPGMVAESREASDEAPSTPAPSPSEAFLQFQKFLALAEREAHEESTRAHAAKAKKASLRRVKPDSSDVWDSK